MNASQHRTNSTCPHASAIPRCACRRHRVTRAHSQKHAHESRGSRTLARRGKFIVIVDQCEGQRERDHEDFGIILHDEWLSVPAGEERAGWENVRKGKRWWKQVEEEWSSKGRQFACHSKTHMELICSAESSVNQQDGQKKSRAERRGHDVQNAHRRVSFRGMCKTT